MAPALKFIRVHPGRQAVPHQFFEAAAQLRAESRLACQAHRCAVSVAEIRAEGAARHHAERARKRFGAGENRRVETVSEIAVGNGRGAERRRFDAGWAVKGVVAGGIIKTLGEAIIAHYEKLERLELESPKVDDKVIEAEIVTDKPSVPPKLIAQTLEQRLERLERLRDAKVITPEEYDAKRREILAEI